MLTDRQEKIYQRISQLSKDNKNIHWTERQYFLVAKNNISSGKDFKGVINTLSLMLSDLEKGKGPAEVVKNYSLSQGSKDLLDEIEKIYGEAADDRPKDWKDSDPDWEYVVSGDSPIWRKRSESAEDFSVNCTLIAMLFLLVMVVVFIFIVF